MAEEVSQIKVPHQLKNVDLTIKTFIQQTEELTRMREAESFIAKLMETPLDLSWFKYEFIPMMLRGQTVHVSSHLNQQEILHHLCTEATEDLWYFQGLFETLLDSLCA